MKVTWSVNLSTVGRVTVLSPNVTCLSVFIRNYQFYQKRPVRPRSASRHSELGCSGSSMTFKRNLNWAQASHQPHVCRTDQGLLRYPFRGVLENKSLKGEF